MLCWEVTCKLFSGIYYVLVGFLLMISRKWIAVVQIITVLK